MIAYERVNHEWYKYRLLQTLELQMSNFLILPEPVEIPGGWVRLDTHGLLTLKRDYHWNGADVVKDVMDTFARASAGHDGGYQMIAAGLLPQKPWKRFFDLEMHRLARQDGMRPLRAGLRYLGVRLFGRGRDEYRPPQRRLN